MSLDNLARIWLNTLSYLEDKGEETNEIRIVLCIDYTLQTFELGYSSGELEYLDKILELCEPEHHTVQNLISILTWSRWGKSKLPHQPVYRDRIIKYLKDTNQYRDGLTLGLED
jgi:hypothetical protein